MRVRVSIRKLCCALVGLLATSAVFAANLPPLGKPVDTSVARLAMAHLQDADTALSLTADGALLYRQEKVKLDGYDYCSEAVALAEKGEFRESARAASKALFVGLQTKNEDLIGKAYRDLAIVYGYAGSLDRAEGFAREALKHPAHDPQLVVGPAWKVIGDVQARQGHYADAIASYRKALAASSDRYRPLVQSSLVNVLIESGDVAGASEALAKLAPSSDPVLSAQIARTRARLLLAEHKPADALALYRQQAAAEVGDESAYYRFWAFDGVARSELALGDKAAAAAAYDQALDSLDHVRALFHSEEFKMGLFSNVQSVFEQAIGLYTDEGDAAKAFDLSERGRARALLDEVRGRGKIAPDMLGVVGVTALRKMLRPDERVVEFQTLPNRLVAWVVTPTNIREVTYPIPRADLIKLVQAFRDSIINGKQSAVTGAAQLGVLLLKPLKLSPGTRLVIIPHGPLHYLPFQALRINGRYLIELHPISVAPSASIAVQLAQKTASIPPSLVAFGDPLVAPQYDLPGAAAEVHAIAAEFPGAQVWLHAQATKTRFEQEAGKARMIHVAAHAEADTIDPMYSRILLASVGGKFEFLEARDVYGLNLHGTALVTLSACESGLGRVAEGDEVLGFERSFLSAGTRSMIVSLWPVSDNAARLLMTTLYGQLAKGVDLQTAMQRAQIAVLKHPDMAHPFFWAPFNVVGDWRLTVGTKP